MVDFEKYKNDGWGLSKKCFEAIYRIVNNSNKLLNVVEFGSGISTEFLVDLIIKEDFKLKIISFDNDLKYSAKVKHPDLKLLIRDLVECSDEDFENQFNEKKYNKDNFKLKTTLVHTRQKNTFYEIKEGDLPDVIDLMIVDGPHGNGRSIAYLHGINRLRKGSYVVIDDYNHYPFVEKMMSLFPDTELIDESNTGSLNQWELGGIYKIFKIL